MVKPGHFFKVICRPGLCIFFFLFCKLFNFNCLTKNNGEFCAVLLYIFFRKPDSVSSCFNKGKLMDWDFILIYVFFVVGL